MKGGFTKRKKVSTLSPAEFSEPVVTDPQTKLSDEQVRLIEFRKKRHVATGKEILALFWHNNP